MISNWLGSAQLRRIDDRQWESIVGVLPDKLSVRAKNRELTYRKFVEGVLWVIGEDAFWGELPREFGSWRALYVRFLRWNAVGVWSDVADIIGRDTALARALMQRADQHAAVVHRRRQRVAQVWMLEASP